MNKLSWQFATALTIAVVTASFAGCAEPRKVPAGEIQATPTSPALPSAGLLPPIAGAAGLGWNLTGSIGPLAAHLSLDVGPEPCDIILIVSRLDPPQGPSLYAFLRSQNDYVAIKSSEGNGGDFRIVADGSEYPPPQPSPGPEYSRGEIGLTDASGTVEVLFMAVNVTSDPEDPDNLAVSLTSSCARVEVQRVWASRDFSMTDMWNGQGGLIVAHFHAGAGIANQVHLASQGDLTFLSLHGPYQGLARFEVVTPAGSEEVILLPQQRFVTRTYDSKGDYRVNVVKAGAFIPNYLVVLMEEIEVDGLDGLRSFAVRSA